MRNGQLRSFDSSGEDVMQPELDLSDARAAVCLVSQVSRWSKDLKWDLALVEPVGVVDADGFLVGSTLAPVVEGEYARVVRVYLNAPWHRARSMAWQF